MTTVINGSSPSITFSDGTTQSTAAGFDSGTAILFNQTSAPTGWTKSVANDNAALRVVSGSVSTGGSVNFTTAFAANSIGATTLSEAQIPSHTHSMVPLSTCGGFGAALYSYAFGG